MTAQRLQKIIAAAGITSRRKAEGLIVDGRVAVNGMVVRELGVRADPLADLVTLDGKPLTSEPLRYFVVNKPAGVLSAVCDDRGRPVVVDLLPKSVGERLYPAGRLDLESDGLVLLTNDGDLMQRLTRPGGPAVKVYDVVVGGRPAEADLERLRRGAELAGRRLLPCTIEVIERIETTGGSAALSRAAAHSGFTRLRISLREGKKNQIRKMFGDIGHRVERLTRVSIGPLVLAGLGPGEARELTPAEVAALRQRASAKADRKRSSRARAKDTTKARR